MTIEEKNEEYKNALVKILHHIESSRVWCGTEWKYQGIPEYRQLKIKKIVDLALFTEKSQDYPVCGTDENCSLKTITGRCTLNGKYPCPHQKTDYKRGL